MSPSTCPESNRPAPPYPAPTYPGSRRPDGPLPPSVARALAAHPRRLLLIGGAGHGKSALLAAIRDRPGPDDARIVDDAHTLDADAVHRLTAAARDGTGPMIVATEPRPHRTDLRALIAEFAGRGALVELTPWSAREIAGHAAASGMTVRHEMIRAVHRLTGGVPDLTEAALAAVRAGTDPQSAVAARVQARLAGDRRLASVLALAELGVAPDAAELAVLLDIDDDRARDIVDAARAGGLLTESGRALIDGARGAPEAVLGRYTCRDLAHRLLRERIGDETGGERSGGVLELDLACRLARSGLRDPALARVLIEGAASAAPPAAAALLDAAVAAGADPHRLAVRRAQCALDSEDLTAAARLSDDLLERTESLSDDDLRGAVRVAATVAARRGMLARSAELYEWLGAERAGPDAALGAAVLLAAGRPDAAARLRAVSSGAPTSGAAAARLLAAGLAESIEGNGPAATNLLARALATRGTTPDPAVPDSIEAVLALLCLHSGELTHARAVLAPTPTVRHRLLDAWALLLGGDLDSAAAATPAASTPVPHERDRFLLHGLRVGLARRSGDIGALRTAWQQAQTSIAGAAVDLFGLLPLGELWLAGVRTGEPERIAHLVSQAHDLLAALGEPPLWAATLHWYGVQAAITANRPGELLPHARALAAAGASTSYAATLARAGHAWLTVLRADVDVDRVHGAARSLAAIGLPWDGARLAGDAALRAPDTATATALLQLARSLRRPGEPLPAPPGRAPEPDRRGATAPGAAGVLSAREAEVADLVVSGLTYREVGARLYISAKTVEHHVARIRRRLGAGSRSELLSMLRALGHGTDAPHRDRTDAVQHGRADARHQSRIDQNGRTPACP